MFASCRRENPSSCILIENPREQIINFKQGMTDLFDDVRYIQLDPDSIITVGDITLLDSLIMVKTDAGIYLYDMNGTFIRQVGKIGQGPEEYNRIFKPVWDGHRKLIHVYTEPKVLLTYSSTGMFLKRVPVLIPDDYVVRSCAYCTDCFYLMQLIGGGIKDKTLWLQVDTLGQVIGKKEDYSLEMNEKATTYSYFGGNYTSSYDSTIIYANHFSDSIYRISENEIAPVAVWAKGDFRLSIRNSISAIEQNSKVLFTGIGETQRWLIIRWYMSYEDKSNERYLTYYDKNELIGYTFKEDIPAYNAYFCSQNNDNFMVYLCQPEDLLLWLPRDINNQREAENIDPEGNPVLVLLRLKNE